MDALRRHLCGIAKHLRKWLSPVGLVAIFSSAAGLVLFTFRGECCPTEMNRNPAAILERE
ncbi:MAG: hypothetical protein DLM60_12555 [Pseudonocardiales bacterium]|nr:MAG: hypothetical protein DLM60_12555 [Pseudonocardiales bacterium]